MPSTTKHPRFSDRLQAEQLLATNQARYVGSYPPVRDGNSQACRVEKTVSNMIGLLEADEVHTFADVNGGFILHYVPQDGEMHPLVEEAIDG